jgi:hypothetical protein
MEFKHHGRWRAMQAYASRSLFRLPFYACSHLFALRNLSEFRKEAGEDVAYITPSILGAV